LVGMSPSAIGRAGWVRAGKALLGSSDLTAETAEDTGQPKMILREDRFCEYLFRCCE
jgi:hypothetical protein